MAHGPRTIGVIGGMGPEATILLQRKVLGAIPARDDADHIPLMIDMNPQVPSRISHLIDATGDDPGPTLAAMARRLQDAGCAALAMPCNTAHYYSDEITRAVSIPLLNMVDLAAKYARHRVGKGGSVGILASPASRKIRLFERAFEAQGISVIWPDCDAEMIMAIRQIKAGGPLPKARTALMQASLELVENGAELQFIACSEFSLIAQSVAGGAPVMDTLDLLAQAVVDFSIAP